MTPPTPRHRHLGRHRARAVALAWVATLTIAISGCGDAGSEVDARALFATNCALCHGAAGEGTADGPALTEAIYLPDQLSDAQAAEAIRDGVPEREFAFGPMPAFPRFADEELDALVELMRELQRDAGVLEP